MITTPNQQEDNALGRILSQRLTLNWELAAYIFILVLALFSRFHMLDARVMSHDESLHTRFAYNLYNEGNFQHTPLMHGPVLFHATAFSFYLFGDGDFSGRIYTALLGVLMVMFPLLWRRWLGRWGALLASVMILISPLLLYYSRYIRHDIPSIFFAMVMAHCILMYMRGPGRTRRRGYWLYIFAAAMILNLGSKETAFLYIAIFGSFLLLYFLVRLAQRRFALPGKFIFYSLMLGILLGGMMTLGMYIVVDIIPAEIISGRGTAWADLSDLQRSSWVSWMALSILSAAFVLWSTAMYAFRDRLARIPGRELLLVFLIALITAGGLLFIEELSHFPQPVETAEPALPDEAVDAAPAGPAIRWAPALALWFLAFGLTAYLIRDGRRPQKASDEPAPLAQDARGIWRTLYDFPEVDFLVLILTLALPWTTALFMRFMGGAEADFAALAEGLPEGLYSLVAGLPNLGGGEQVGQFLVGASVFAPLFMISVVIGLSWNWRRWLISAAIFHVIFAFFFTSVFTNIAGLGTGMIYSLGYWLEQQGVRRGSQPQYYYLLIIMPTYEFLPVIGSVSAMFASVAAYWKRRRRRIVQREEEQESQLQEKLEEDHENSADASAARGHDDDKLSQLPFVLLLAWWAILNLVGYSLAGEKMPWLGTHLTTPLIFICAWYFGGIIARIDRAKFRFQGWIALLALPLFLICLAQALGAWLIGDPPFRGLSLLQLERTYEWMASLLIALGLGYVLFRLARSSSWLHIRRLCAATLLALLCLATARAAWRASFINYDLPTELLVYAHAAPAVKWALKDIEEMSLRLTDGRDLKFAYDDEVSWPYSWYFRDFNDAVFVGANPTVQNTEDAIFVVIGAGHRGDVEPILEDRYLRRDYIRMWWPMQEYFGLTPQRILNVLDFSAGNQEANALRQGIFDIWWSRDYERYGIATGKDFSLTNWPVSDRMHVYIRKDFAAQIWEYGVGDGEVPSNIPTEINQCAANWRSVSPLLLFDTSAAPLRNPLALTVADGLVYVADEGANLIRAFTVEGQYLRDYGDAGGSSFNRPNSLAILPNADLLVVDTWNYRIQRVSPEDAVQMIWGAAAEYGFDAPAAPADGFWGPRDVALDSSERIYIADTGNKRIRVYALEDSEAVHLQDIGGGGSGPGELNEPSGLAIHSDGRLYVADTWNRRVAVFDVSGAHLMDFRVRGWYNDTFNRPYLALDEARDTLYVSDPDGRRILVHDGAGNCIGSFGEEGDLAAQGQFRDIGGVAVDGDGFVYVTDSSLGAILKFPPFPRE